jgi:hypothetical protein
LDDLQGQFDGGDKKVLPLLSEARNDLNGAIVVSGICGLFSLAILFFAKHCWKGMQDYKECLEMERMQAKPVVPLVEEA